MLKELHNTLHHTMYLPRVRAVEHCKVPEEASVETWHVRRRVRVDGGHVRHGFHIAPRVGFGVVESSIVYVLTDQLHSGLVVEVIHLWSVGREYASVSCVHANGFFLVRVS